MSEERRVRARWKQRGQKLHVRLGYVFSTAAKNVHLAIDRQEEPPQEEDEEEEEEGCCRYTPAMPRVARRNNPSIPKGGRGSLPRDVEARLSEPTSTLAQLTA